MTIGADGLTPYGATPEDVARALDGWGADVIGLNCSVGPQTILEAIEKMAPLTRRKLSAQPNAGMPRDVGGRSMYMASPEYMATYARHLVQAGAKVVGGCCGTTPEHIHAMCEGIRPLVPAASRRASVRYQLPTRGRRRRDARDASRAPTVRAGAVRRALALGARRSPRGEFVTSVEIVPPRGVDATRMLADVRALKDAGVDAVNVPDGPRAQSRMGALLTSAAHRAAGRHRDGHALRLPRPQPARHAERPAGRVGDGAPQPAAHHRRSAEDGAVSRRDGGVRHRLDRADESREQPESRAAIRAATRSARRRGSRSASA